jgi:uncharacterized protein YprB with RNaseH-like and TPR domain
MASNLKSRLQRIRNMAQTESISRPQEDAIAKTKEILPLNVHENHFGFGNEWQQAGFKFLKRSVISNIDFDLAQVLPNELTILVPDFLKTQRKIINPEDIIFFDLETTGLSGGAGTVAFLAAVGFFVCREQSSANKVTVPSYSLQIDQYLLLDYPGESDFLETIIPILNDEKKIIVTYNGKSFDTKLFRTRCLMNGMKPPCYHEADLLHPARRLWKSILPNCSQAKIETSILGLDRTGDLSGAFAPQIWFDYLKNENPSDLLKICDHNKKDIEGLASLFSLITNISKNPLKVLENYSFDIEAAALQWRNFARYFQHDQCAKDQAERLMSFCVEKKYPKAILTRAYDLLKKGFHDEGSSLLKKLVEMEISPSLRISALNSLAIDAEWRLKDCIKAINYVESLLQIENLSESFKNKAKKRRERLLKKVIF